MSSATNIETFWLRLLTISDAARQDAVSLEQLRDMLQGIDEGFGEIFDPVDTFNEFVALGLCRSIRQLIDTDERSQARQSRSD